MRWPSLAALGIIALAGSATAQTLQPTFVQPLGISLKTLARTASALDTVRRGPPTAAPWEAALAFSEQQPDSFKAALKLADEYPRAFIALAATGEASTTAVSLALKTTRFTDLTALLLRISDSAQRAKAIEAATVLRQKIEAAAFELSPRTQVAVFADGNIRGIASGKGDGNTAATGSLGLRVTQGRSIWGAQINVASSIDTAKSGFAQTLLSPGTGSTLLAGLVDYRLRRGERWGLHVYGSVSRGIWRDTSTAQPLSRPAAAASVAGVGALVYWDPFLDPGNENPVALSFEIGPTFRTIGGDIAEADSLRTRLLNGSSRKTFLGLEAGFQLTFNDITGALQIYLIGGDHIDGVTGLQVTAGFSIHAAVFTKAFGGTKPLSTLGQ